MRRDVRAQGRDGAITVYICALCSNNKGEECAPQMNASTRLMFTVAGCALGVAAVGGIVVCLGVLLP